MLVLIVWFLLSATFVDLAGYWLHRWSHRKGSPVYPPHMIHHVVNYPPRDFFSDRYRGAGKDSLTIWYMPFALLYVMAIMLCHLPHSYVMLVGGGASALLNSVLHDLTHRRRSWVWRWRPTRGVAIRHHAHHFKMGRNFGLVTPAWDVLFGTRRDGGGRGSSRAPRWRDPPARG